MDKEIIVLVGPPGSGKSTEAMRLERDFNYVRVSTDDQGKNGCMEVFNKALNEGKDIVIDRMNFDKNQRSRFLEPARNLGYKTIIKVFQVPKSICYVRCMERKNHPTVKCHTDASNALSFFFKSYVRPTNDEADIVEFFGHTKENTYMNYAFWDSDIGTEKDMVVLVPPTKVVVFDIDGTVADIEHRRHHVQRIDGKKKDWRLFNLEMINDTPKPDIVELVKVMAKKYHIVFCSGRTDDFRKVTEEWLDKALGGEIKYELYMRPRNDSRQDNIIKEIILDFELLPRYDILFVVDDRDQVVKMWRDRGITCLQCAYGDF